MSIDIVGGEEFSSDAVVSKVSFHHVNLDAGNESVLLRFEYETRDEAACVLVDAGEHVDLDAYLGATDELAAVCLTHAHADHYQSLGRVLRDDTPLYTSPATADILETVLTSAEDSGFVADPDRILAATTPVDDWTEVAPGVRIHPVPAGHTPGAVGFVIRFSDGESSHDMLFTGDFTLDSAGGYPGLDPAVAPDVEALFLTVSTADDASGQLTDGIATAVERANAGGRVLVTTGGLQGVHTAALLATVSAELDLDVPVRVVGQAAKLYEDLGYDLAGVESVPEFARPESCLDCGCVTVAGPDVPTEGSAGRLYEAIEDDPNACLVQFVSSGETPRSKGSCATFDYQGGIHPTEEVLETLVDEFDPVEVVTVHEHGGAGDEYNVWDPCVWSTTKDERLELYEDGRWLTPRWMEGQYARVPEQRRDVGSIVGDQFGDLSLASLDRAARIDLDDEGIDVDQIRQKFRHEDDFDSANTHSTPAMTDSSDADSESSRTETTLYPTADVQVDATRSLSDDSLAPRNIVSKRAWDELGSKPVVETADADADADGADERRASSDETDTTAVDTDTDAATAETEPESTSTSENSGTVDTAATSETAAEQTEETQTTDDDSGVADTAGAPAPEQADVTGTEGPVDDVSEPTTDSDGPEADSAQPAVDDTSDTAVTIDVDPLLLALVERQTEESVDRFVTDALQAYLEALLRQGEPPEGTTDSLDIGLSTGDRLGQALGDAVDDEGYDSVPAAVRTALAELLGSSDASTVTVSDRAVSTGFIDAAVDNDEYGFETRRNVVDAAVLWALDD